MTRATCPRPPAVCDARRRSPEDDWRSEPAVEQLEPALRGHGVRGERISTPAGPGVELDDPTVADSWAAAEELDTAVLIHPEGWALGERLDAHNSSHSVGHPTGAALALLRTVFAGLLERHPRLRIRSACDSGYLAGYVMRAGHAWSGRPDAHTTEQLPRCTGVDSLVHPPGQLHHLVDVMRPIQVTLGSDLPRDTGVEDPVGRLEAGLDVATTDAIRGGAAAGLLGLDR
nr:amidohydrolase family protein [Geodermatophilus telluris]